MELGLAGEVLLGDLDAVRDWSFAGDVMRGAWLMLQQEQPDDYVLASGDPHTVAELAEAAFGASAGTPSLHPVATRARARAGAYPPGGRSE